MEQQPNKKRPRPRAFGTGSIFKPKGSRLYWIAYMSGGKRQFEATKTDNKSKAQEILSSRLGDISKGMHVTSKMGRKTLDDGLKAVIANLKMNGRKGVAEVQRQIDLHLLTYFQKDRRMSNITTGDLTAYTSHRIEQGASAATCNHELATVRRAFRLAVRGGELATMPYVPMLTLNNARRGFFERHQLDAVLAYLPQYLHGLLKFAFITGWRIQSEILPLTVAQVDMQAGVVRLEPGLTKNHEGRSFFLTEELRTLLQTQLSSVDALKEQDIICPYVFHRPDGSRIKSFRGSWEVARVAAGLPGAICHDFRRTAVRNLERAGVPRSTAMQMVGHKTEAIYRRYAIVDEAMHREAATKLDNWAVEQKAKADAEPKGQVKRFEKRQAG